MNPHGKHHPPAGMPLPVTSRQHASASQQQGAASPISMPGRQRFPKAPPPLPPPRFVEDPALPVMESRGLNFSEPRRQWDSEELTRRRDEPSWEREDDRFQREPEFHQRQRDNDPSWSPKDSQASFPWKIDEGYHSMLSISTQLHGERQLHHRGQEKSSQAYDNKLLSKIGKPKTPPGHRSFASAESSPTSSLSFSRQPFPQSRSLSFPNSVTSGYSDSPIKTEPGLGFGDSPHSRPVSPGTYSPFPGRNFTEYRSPTQDNSTRSSTLDSDCYSPYHQRFPRIEHGLNGGGSGGGGGVGNENPRSHQKGRRSIGQSSLSNVDESASLEFGKNTAKFHASLPTRPVKQENYESIFSEQEPTFRMEESVDQLHLDDRAFHPAHRDSVPRNSGQVIHHLKSQRSMGGGTKRKAPPEASEASHEPSSQPSLQQMASTASHFAQQNPPSHLSPGFAQHHGSVSSQSSAGAFRNGSYASSGGVNGGVPSVGGSSYTSLDQTSPGAISPSDPQHPYQQNLTQDTSYNHSLSMDPNSRAGPYPDPTQPQQQLHDAAFLDTKPTPPRKEARKNNAPQNLSTSSFICECCPKKPRKFDTVEEKIQHEEEKQYRCMYCHNRFKNKNEAERHQNSLHLRRHSWSCAVLAQNFGAAFFPSTELPNVNITPGQPEAVSSATDTCGYCGTEFTNEPAPDWDERTRHLDIVHKFRECNQSKKFFRADHFRQHLKHSHAGASGKWTNRLEQACIKEEPPATPLDQQTPDANSTLTQSAPIANMGSTNQQDINQQSPSMNHNHSSHNNYSSHPSMIGQQNLAQMDMSNIDPNIGIQQLSELAAVGNMNNVVPGAQQQQAQQQAHQQQPPQQQALSSNAVVVGGGGYDELKHDPL